uniref:Uncharacterized protein n=1 Tax=Heterorhabditis bacteriophora TaxID=37862 RepID=A0A1I7WB46_HETBA
MLQSLIINMGKCEQTFICMGHTLRKSYHITFSIAEVQNNSCSVIRFAYTFNLI